MFSSINFENFISLLSNLPKSRQNHPNLLLDVFHELDHDQDSFITFDDLQFVLPNLTGQFNRDVFQAAIDIIDIEHDTHHLSYFDFVINFILLSYCNSTIVKN